MYWACLWNHCGAQMRDKRSRTALWWGGAVTWHVFVFFKLRHLQPLPSAGSFSLFHLPKYTSRSNTTIARLSPGCVGQIRLSERQTGFWRKGLKTRRRSVACAAPAHKQSVKKKKKKGKEESRSCSLLSSNLHTPLLFPVSQDLSMTVQIFRCDWTDRTAAGGVMASYLQVRLPAAVLSPGWGVSYLSGCGCARGTVGPFK